MWLCTFRMPSRCLTLSDAPYITPLSDAGVASKCHACKIIAEQDNPRFLGQPEPRTLGAVQEAEFWIQKYWRYCKYFYMICQNRSSDKNYMWFFFKSQKLLTLKMIFLQLHGIFSFWTVHTNRESPKSWLWLPSLCLIAIYMKYRSNWRILNEFGASGMNRTTRGAVFCETWHPDATPASDRVKLKLISVQEK